MPCCLHFSGNWVRSSCAGGLSCRHVRAGSRSMSARERERRAQPHRLCLAHRRSKVAEPAATGERRSSAVTLEQAAPPAFHLDARRAPREKDIERALRLGERFELAGRVVERVAKVPDGGTVAGRVDADRPRGRGVRVCDRKREQEGQQISARASTAVRKMERESRAALKRLRTGSSGFGRSSRKSSFL
jgi:hypothetical protein